MSAGDEDDTTERTTETTASEAEPSDGSELPDSQSAEPAASASDREWRFELEDLPDTEDGDEQSGNVTGTLETRQPLEPGDINLENAFFVLVGIFIVVGLLLGMVLGF